MRAARLGYAIRSFTSVGREEPREGVRGQAGSTTSTAVVSDRPAKAPDPSPDDRSYYQTKIASFVKNSLDVTAQAVLSSDRRYVRVSLAPVAVPTAAADNGPPTVADPVIPGGY